MTISERHAFYENSTYPIIGYQIEGCSIIEVKIMGYDLSTSEAKIKTLTCFDVNRKSGQKTFRCSVDMIIHKKTEAEKLAKQERFYIETYEHHQQVSSLLKEKIEMIYKTVDDTKHARHIVSCAVSAMLKVISDELG